MMKWQGLPFRSTSDYIVESGLEMSSIGLSEISRRGDSSNNPDEKRQWPEVLL